MHAMIGALMVLVFWLGAGFFQAESGWTMLVMALALGGTVGQLCKWKKKISELEKVQSKASRFMREFFSPSEREELGASVNSILHYHANHPFSTKNVEELFLVAKEGEGILDLNLCLLDTADDYKDPPPSPHPADRRPPPAKVA